MFGFLAAVGLAVAVAAVLLFSGTREIATPTIAPDLPNGEMVQRFDSYIFRARKALPAPAQAEIDLLSQRLAPLKETLARVDQNDPDAQDARRLMSSHLPGLIDRYLHVPASYRGEYDAEGKSVDDRWSMRCRRGAPRSTRSAPSSRETTSPRSRRRAASSRRATRTKG